MENWQSLQSKLLAAARANPPSDRVPYAFEKRVTALIVARSAIEPLGQWVRGLWRAAVSSMAVALLLVVWAVFNPAASSKTDDLSQNFENTLLASVDQSDLVQ
jgi:anti-sigma-K factor RskA